MKAWRDSASLILAAQCNLHCKNKHPQTAQQCNYNLLCVKRHQNSNTVPGSYVFPGGIADPSDADLKWYNLFGEYGFDKSSFNPLFPKANNRPFIFDSKENELPREMSLRITAIRETFEECGVLLCKQPETEQSRPNFAQPMSVGEHKLQEWQKKVHNDTTQFYQMCKTFNCYPDVWSLYEWRNWLTPTIIPGNRHNAAFFVACLSYIPHTIMEATEIEDIRWDSPKGFMDSAVECKLPPPQRYEITTIGKFIGLENLLRYAIERSATGASFYLPVQHKLSNGKVHVLPGDSMYPENVSLTEQQVIDKSQMTIEEFREISPLKNRMEFPDSERSNVPIFSTEYIKDQPLGNI